MDGRGISNFEPPPEGCFLRIPTFVWHQDANQSRQSLGFLHSDNGSTGDIPNVGSYSKKIVVPQRTLKDTWKNYWVKCAIYLTITLFESIIPWSLRGHQPHPPHVETFQVVMFKPWSWWRLTWSLTVSAGCNPNNNLPDKLGWIFLKDS